MGLEPHIIDLSQVYKVGEDLVGKKAHELGGLWKLGIPLPKGFVITTQFQEEFLLSSGIDKEIKNTQALKHPALSDCVDKLFLPIQKRIMQTHTPQNLSAELHKFYRWLAGVFKNRSLNIFSSSSNNKSVVFFDIKGDTNLVLKIKTIWSLVLDKSVAIVVQESLKKQTRGKVITDNQITGKNLTEQQILELTNYCKIIQKHFYFPQEIEYAVIKSKIIITKISPSTDISTIKNKFLRKVLIQGTPLNPGIVTGSVKIFRNKFNHFDVKKDEIVILHDFDQKTFKKIKNARAVIVELILPNSSLKALYRRDFRIPTVAGIKNAAKMFENGRIVTVNGVNGEIYSGGLIC